MATKLSKGKKKLFAGIISCVILTICIILFSSTQDVKLEFTRSSAETFENNFYDLFFKATTSVDDDETFADDKVAISKNYDPNIFIVDIDEPSLTKLGNYNEWDRSIHANVIKNLSAGGAAAIGLDILFKNADFGQQKATQVVNLLKDMYPNVDWNNAQIQARLNFDSLLVKAAKEKGIQGRVNVKFTVDKTGHVTNVSVLNGVEQSLDEEAVRVISSSPKWTPGKDKDGNCVDVTYTFPVIFQAW